MSVAVRNRLPAAEVERISFLADDEWDAALAAAGRPFRFSHRAIAGRALEAAYPSYSFAPCRVDYRDGAKILYPLVRVSRRIRTLSMMVGMPLGLEGTPIAVAGEIKPAHVAGLARARELKGLLRIHGGAGGSPPPVGRVTPLVTHVLDLRDGFDTVWSKSFHKTTRTACRAAERAGVRVAEETTPAALDAYFELYARSSASWGYAEPPYPRPLFNALLRSGKAELWLARLDGRPIAGRFLLEGSEDLFFWSSAVDREYRRVRPGNAVHLAVIKSACERGIAYLDLGGSADLPGVEAFKRSFGAQPREYRAVAVSSPLQRRLIRLERRLRDRGGDRA